MTWDLSRLYRSFDDPQFEAEMQQCAQLIEDARSLCADIGTADGLCKMLSCMQKVRMLCEKLNNYIYLSLAADANCTKALAPRQRMQEIENAYAVAESAFVRRIGADDSLDSLIAQHPMLREHAPFLKNAMEKAAHTIDPALETTVLKMQMTGGSAWVRLRDELFAGLTCDLELDGETRKLPLTAVRAMAHDNDASVRLAAYRAEMAAYPKLEVGMAACLNGIEGEANTLAQLQQYESVLDWSLALSRMDRMTLDAMLDAMRASLPIFRSYFRLKNHLLGNKGALKFCDLFAPVGSSTRKYTLEEAKETLIDVFSKAHPPIAETMRRAFDESLIDAYPREGKEGGAFCAGVHAVARSYVLTNFDGSYSDVSTLAHELGHAYQDACLSKQSILLDELPMPLAETASTFNEILLADKMAANADVSEQIMLLDQQLTDAAQVIVDILSRFIFESEVIERRKKSSLTAHELCEIMHQAQLDTYGDGLDPAYLHPYMWACKPHYYDTELHFYNYPYAFGLLFASGLYGLYGKRGDDFWPLYDRLLKESGSGSVRDVAASVGIDLTKPDFWADSFRIYEEKVNHLAELTGYTS